MKLLRVAIPLLLMGLCAPGLALLGSILYLAGSVGGFLLGALARKIAGASIARVLSLGAIGFSLLILLLTALRLSNVADTGFLFTSCAAYLGTVWATPPSRCARGRVGFVRPTCCIVFTTALFPPVMIEKKIDRTVL